MALTPRTIKSLVFSRRNRVFMFTEQSVHEAFPFDNNGVIKNLMLISAGHRPDLDMERTTDEQVEQWAEANQIDYWKGSQTGMPVYFFRTKPPIQP